MDWPELLKLGGAAVGGAAASALWLWRVAQSSARSRTTMEGIVTMNTERVLKLDAIVPALAERLVQLETVRPGISARLERLEAHTEEIRERSARLEVAGERTSRDVAALVAQMIERRRR